MLGLHHHRVAPGDQQIGHLGVMFEIAVQEVCLGGGHAQLFVADELCPAEAEGAVAVAGLALAGKEQDRFAILVLQAVQPLARGARRDIQLHLPGRVWIQLRAQLRGKGLDFLTRKFPA